MLRFRAGWLVGSQARAWVLNGQVEREGPRPACVPENQVWGPVLALRSQVGRYSSGPAYYHARTHVLTGTRALEYSGEGVLNVREGRPLSKYVAGEE